MAERKTSVSRDTKETQITVTLNLDGTGVSGIATGTGFFDHMLTLMARHGFMDLDVDAKGDLEVGCHHTVEDIGIVFGNTVAALLPDKKGISRYGSAAVPMDEALARVNMDVSNRAVLVYNVPLARAQVEDFDGNLIEHFFQAFVSQAGVTLHINLEYGKDPHHCFEAVFKAFGRALHNATRPDSRVKGVLSTKGTI